MERPYFPMFIDMTDKSVLVAGGGRIALRRVRTMLRFGVQVRVAAPELCPELAEMERSGQICAVHRAYETGDLEGVSFVLATTDSREVNRQIRGDCREKAIPVNVSDNRELCDFYFPSVVMTEDAVIGISSGGEDPGRTKELRRKIEETLGERGWYE